MPRLVTLALTVAFALPFGALPLTAAAQDVGKKLAEAPTEKLLEESAPDDRGGRAAPTKALVNPRVAQGKIRWHADTTIAHAAARKSGKPVLVFQLLGRLDQEFC